MRGQFHTERLYPARHGDLVREEMNRNNKVPRIDMDPRTQNAGLMLPLLQTAILYQNLSKTVTLLDIPQSISLSQGTLMHPNQSLKIFSIPPLQTPFPSLEPKSEAARAKVIRAMGPNIEIEFPSSLLHEALEEIKGNFKVKRDWCLPRHLSKELLESAQKLAKSGHEDHIGDDKVTTVTKATEPGLHVFSTFNGRQRKANSKSRLVLARYTVNRFPNELDITSIPVHNPHPTPAQIMIESRATRHLVPPGAVFYSGNIDDSSASDFSIAAQSFFSTPSASAGPGQFDFVVLDPPWNNRSAKRSRRYDTMRQKRTPFDSLQDMLGKHIAPQGLIACWITNRAVVRKRALQAFEAWGVDLIEEWAWLKTTATGIPMTEIHGLLRKPYEILLLGKHVDLFIEKIDEKRSSKYEIRKKVIVAVPDLHSRKPSLKELVEPLMPNPTEYRALEIFGRHLTAGWWSWGNEAMKYNCEGFWQRVDRSETNGEAGLDKGLQVGMNDESR